MEQNKLKIEIERLKNDIETKNLKSSEKKSAKFMKEILKELNSNIIESQINEFSNFSIVDRYGNPVHKNKGVYETKFLYKDIRIFSISVYTEINDIFTYIVISWDNRKLHTTDKNIFDILRNSHNLKTEKLKKIIKDIFKCNKLQITYEKNKSEVSITLNNSDESEVKNFMKSIVTTTQFLIELVYLL
ncbi:hypothetical protein [Clostridium cochlearium]|uniref:hypothetical protein n=1 Tax=Clostridium cochlearium TaxID=1494 RepID=UPI00241DFD73|nr:hypothetical protein [Clostridium cochlearium]MBE6064828.1 hypothetical protein [Clostridium cochlearium]